MTSSPINAGLLDLYGATGSVGVGCGFALRLQATQDELFWDAQGGAPTHLFVTCNLSILSREVSVGSIRAIGHRLITIAVPCQINNVATCMPRPSVHGRQSSSAKRKRWQHLTTPLVASRWDERAAPRRAILESTLLPSLTWHASFHCAGGYFSTAGDDPSILLRMKEDYDGAEPAASSISVSNLARLAALARPEEAAAPAPVPYFC